MNNSLKKITIFIQNLDGGGAEKVIVNLIKSFIKRNIEIDLILAKAEGVLIKELPTKVRIINLNKNSILYSIPDLIKYIKNEKPEVILSTLDHVNVATIIARKLSKIDSKLILRLSSTITADIKNNTFIKRIILPHLIKILYPLADRIIAISKETYNDLQKIVKINPQKVKIIYNPIDISEISSKANEEVSHPWFNKGEPPVIISAGRLNKAKDYPTLLKAFSIVHKKLPSRLMILGKGEEENNLKKLAYKLRIEKDFYLKGFEENPFKYMKRASVFVLSSKWEGLPNVLIEALALKIPIVSTNCKSGPSEILENGKWGRLVEVGDYHAMAEAIIETLNSKRKIDQNELNEYLKIFDINNVSENYIRTIQEIL